MKRKSRAQLYTAIIPLDYMNEEKERARQYNET